jgi:hypothetical protein
MTTTQLDISDVEDKNDKAIEIFDIILATALSNSGAVPVWLSSTQEVVKAGQAVHQQIYKLQVALRKYGKEHNDAEDMALIADFGMIGFMGGHEIPMLDAIVALKRSNGEASHVLDVKQKASSFLDYLMGSELIGCLDNAPSEIGYQTTIRDTLGRALSELIKKL